MYRKNYFVKIFVTTILIVSCSKPVVKIDVNKKYFIGGESVEVISVKNDKVTWIYSNGFTQTSSTDVFTHMCK